MRNKYKSSLEFIGLLLLFSLCIFAPGKLGAQQIQAVIRELAGTVEFMKGASGIWEPASRGQILTGDSALSTGFKSTAVIAFGSSLVTMRPLTRLSLTELSKINETEKVELNLQTGRVRNDVKAPEGGKTEFVIRSSRATSSVRGTVFEFDTTSLQVLEGTVDYKGTAGAPQLIDAIGYSSINEQTGRPSLPKQEELAVLTPELPIATEFIPVSAAPPDETTAPPPPNPGSPSNPSSPSNPASPQDDPGFLGHPVDVTFN
jgi:hypothetical protein